MPNERYFTRFLLSSILVVLLMAAVGVSGYCFENEVDSACPKGMTDDCCACNTAEGFFGSVGHCKVCFAPSVNPDDDPELEYACDYSGTNGGDISPDGKCTCACRNKYTGQRCEVCPPTADPSNGKCDTCLPGNADYIFPNATSVCSPLCTTGDCNNKGTPASGSTHASGCGCQCTSNYDPSTSCAVCLEGYDIAGECATCSPGYEYAAGDGKCYRTCTMADCASGAAGVSGNSKTGCVCACSNKWYGKRCELCPALMDAQCANCVPGYEVPGNCTRTCTMADCNGKATDVTGNERVGCSCACRNSWYGQVQSPGRYRNCTLCPAHFNVSSDCLVCDRGYQFDGGQCREQCTTAVDCYGHADTVVGVKGQCSCWCRNQYDVPSNCSFCPERYAGDDCNACANNFIEYPLCKRNCTTSGDCSSHATAVTGFPNNTCSCECRNKWSGSRCEVCPPAFDGSVLGDCAICNQTTHEGIGMQCYRKCTVIANCSGRADSVTGNDNTVCDCACHNKWGGDRCDVCPPNFNVSANCGTCMPQYELYPRCVLKCTNAANCTGHAVNVSGNIADGCNCPCDPATKWEGAKCEHCPANYEQSACKTCAANYTRYPDCFLKCTVAANCSGHASNVTGDSGSGCNCTCEGKWQGPTCSVCPSPGGNLADGCKTCLDGYGGPRCERICTIDTDCGGPDHATNVSGFESNCNCTCRNHWAGSSCGVCPPRYELGHNCDGCAAGYVNPPFCFLNCTVAANCSGNAVSVEGDSSTGCTCSCRNQWSGGNCSRCEANYMREPDCNACAPTYNFYPTCIRDCSVEQDCGGAAQSSGVTGIYPNCSCTCKNMWLLPSCTVCPNMYDPAKDCNACAPGHRGTFPFCHFVCTTAANCSSHATDVVGDSSTRCNCTCTNHWEGSDCSYCPPKYDPATNCSTCNKHYTGYPECRYVCNDELDCSGHSTNVTGMDWNCSCTCRNHWGSSNCGVCPTKYNATEDCAVCADAYDSYPDCFLTCTVAANCSGNALNVTGNSDSGCNCSCRNMWTGPSCAVCPPTYDPAADCNACIPGWAGFPNCRELCTNETDCSSRADVVEGYKGACTCHCRNGYAGDRCESCPPRYEAAADCGTCAEGFDTYPLCDQTCTIVRDCDDKAVNVSGNYGTGCDCTCRNMWSSANCTYCAPQHEPRADCGMCADGYTGYPQCDRICTNWDDCSGNAALTTGLFPNCSCVCKAQWLGDDCSYCPPRYDPSDCAACADGYTGVYPQCDFICTIAANCSSHASSVNGTTLTGCGCKCRNQWHGGDCSQCDVRYNAAKDCAACAYGFESYPECRTACMVERDCSTHAHNVTGIYPNCKCACRNQWLGDRCDVCPERYNATADCAACNANRDTYPHCYLRCNFTDCSGNAVEVQGNEFTGCSCKCRNSWTGERCDVCPATVNASKDCGECIAGYAGVPPLCGPLCTPSDCTNRSVTVSGGRPHCNCTCRNGWSGQDCSVCPPEYNISTDCFACMPGHTKVNGKCYRNCNVSLDCNVRGTNVTGNLGVGCNCTCRNNYTAPTCASCAAGYNASADCTGCAEGFGGFPLCRPLCTNETDCTGRAESVSGIVGSCRCVCRKGWWGPRCDICPAQYNIWDDCGSCNKYRRQNYPNCSRLSRSMPTPTFTSVLHTLTNIVPSNTTTASLPLHTFTASSLSQYLSSTASLDHTYSVSTTRTGSATVSRSGTASFSLEATESRTRPETRSRPVPPTRTGKITVTLSLPDCNDKKYCVHANSSHRDGYVCRCHCTGNWTGLRCDECPERYTTYKDSNGVPQGCSACAKGYVARGGRCLTSDHFYGTLDAGNASCDGSVVTTRNSLIGVGSRVEFLSLLSADMHSLLMGVYAHRGCPNAALLASNVTFGVTVYDMYATSAVVPARDVRYLFDAVFWNESKAVAHSMSECMTGGFLWLLDVWRNGGVIPTTAAPTTPTTMDPRFTTTAATRTPRPTFAPAGAAAAGARAFAAHDAGNSSDDNASSDANTSSSDTTDSTAPHGTNSTATTSPATNSTVDTAAGANETSDASSSTTFGTTEAHTDATSYSTSTAQQTTTTTTVVTTAMTVATTSQMTTTSTTMAPTAPPPTLFPLLFFGSELIFSTRAASDYIGALIGINGTGCLAFAGGSASYGDNFVCGIIGCAPIDYDEIPPEPKDEFPWGWIVMGLIGAALLLAAILAFRRYRLNRRIEEVVNPKDTHKYTLQFLLSEDEELRQIAQDREDEEVGFFDDDDLL